MTTDTRITVKPITYIAPSLTDNCDVWWAQDDISVYKTVVFKGRELFAEKNLHGWDKNIA